MTWTVRMEEIPRRSWTFSLCFESLAGSWKEEERYPSLEIRSWISVECHLVGKIFNPDQVGGKQGLHLQYSPAAV